MATVCGLTDGVSIKRSMVLYIYTNTNLMSMHQELKSNVAYITGGGV